jgi:TatA/E family protein of Tat protein translocase
LGGLTRHKPLLYDAKESETATAMLSIPHLIIIFVVALVVFGPQKLPELARNLGKIMAEFRRATGDLRSTFDEHMRELERESQAIEQRKRELDIREAAVRSAQAALPQPVAADGPVISVNEPVTETAAPPESPFEAK